MSYNSYLYSIDKSKYNNICDLSMPDFYKLNSEPVFPDGYISGSEIGDEVYYLGSAYFDDFIENIKSDPDSDPNIKHYQNFFSDKKLNKIYNEETELYLIEKEFLELIIESYRIYINNYYSNMLKTITSSGITEISEKNLSTICNHIRSMSFEWIGKEGPYKLSNLTDSITTSHKYEYAIFELIRIYKTFDWENKNMFFYGG